MKVQLRLYADLARSLGGGVRVKPCDVPDGITIEELLRQLEVDERPGLIVGLNGKLANRAARLEPGDEVELMTAMEGGA
jgi:sulfur carrier protein ThiS